MTETFIHDEDLDLNDFTPAMRQFIEVKRRYPETLVLFRMGDFYETFFDDAAKANRLIGITLTKRGKLKNGDPIPMAGIPMVSLDQYVARLVRLGESVVIAEQLGTPGKGLMERRISRIITPGTLTDTSLLPEKDDAVLLSVSRPAGKNAVWGFAWLTLSNGDFFATEVTDEQFDSEVARISPSEVLVSEKLRDDMRETHPELTVTPMPAWHFDAEHGEEALKKTFGLDNLDAWGVTGKTGVLAAANALLDYTAETQVDMIPFISPLKLTDESEYIIIDPASRRNLEISDTIRSEGRGPTLFSVLDRCGTSMGSRELRRWLNLPLTKADEARGRHDALEALAENQDFSSFVETRLQGLPDIERIASRIALGTVRPKELAALRDALPLVGELNAEIASREETWFGMTAKTLSLPAEIFSNLEAALLPEPATLLREGDVLAIDYADEAPLGTLGVNAYAYPYIGGELLDSVLPYLTYLTPFTYGITPAGVLAPLDDARLLERAARYGAKSLMHLSTLTPEGNFSSENAAALLQNALPRFCRRWRKRATTASTSTSSTSRRSCVRTTPRSSAVCARR